MNEFPNNDIVSKKRMSTSRTRNISMAIVASLSLYNSESDIGGIWQQGRVRRKIIEDCFLAHRLHPHEYRKRHFYWDSQKWTNNCVRWCAIQFKRAENILVVRWKNFEMTNLGLQTYKNNIILIFMKRIIIVCRKCKV